MSQGEFDQKFFRGRTHGALIGSKHSGHTPFEFADAQDLGAHHATARSTSGRTAKSPHATSQPATAHI